MQALFSALRLHAEQSPDAVALIGDSRALSYSELWRQIRSLADGLRAHGEGVIGLAGENSLQWAVADIAASLAGRCVVPLPPFFSSAQFAHVIRSTGMRQVLACGNSTDGIDFASQLASPVDGVVLLHMSGLRDAQTCAAIGTRKITFTSGTTGAPKGVCIDDSMLDAVISALAKRIHAGHAIDADASHRHFCLLPLSTLLENIAGIYVPLMLGKTAVVLSPAETGLHGSSQLDLGALVKALHAHQANSLIVLPQILAALVAGERHGIRVPACMRFVAVGGAATAASLIAQAQAVGIPVFEGYGLSECASVVALNSPNAQRIGSVGKVLDHVRVRIVDGQIEVTGNVSPGYLGHLPNRPDDVWLRTGDLGRIDDEGFLYISGRSSNLMISSYGRNISPEWIEAELALCPLIAQAMVIGDARPFCAAIIVPRTNDLSALRAALVDLNQTLPDYARIARFIVATESFSASAGTLTDNGRLRREAICSQHAAAIHQLYSEPHHFHEAGAIDAVL